MSKRRANRCAFQVREGNLGDVCAFVGDMLSRKDVSDETAKEAVLVFEALMQALVDWGLPEGTDLEVSGTDRLGEFKIKVVFEGKMFVRDVGEADSIEARILDAHHDKLDYSYHAGCNVIGISVSRGHRTLLTSCAVASLCAIAAYLLLSFLVGEQERHDLFADYVYPLETMYTNAMLMVGAPMTFFSLLKSLTDTYIVSQRSSGVRRLQKRTFATSVFAILLAFVSFFALSAPLTALDSTLYGDSGVLGGSIDRTFSDVVTSFVTPSIFEPFAAVSPIPLIVVALLSAYALCSSGKYFDALRHAMMACYTLFSRMLHVVVAVLPLFCFLAFMDLLLDTGIEALAETLGYFVAIGLGILLLLATYAVRLRVHGIRVVSFARKLVPLLRENFRIGSAIDAAPYNVRYCTKVFKMSRGMLERNLPVLAEINLDGNCFVLAFFAFAFALVMGAHLSWLNIVGLAVLVLFLSLGAPNQPGGILIGSLIIAIYLGWPEELCLAIISEAFFGDALNLINVIGDIVMVAIDDSKLAGE